MAILPPTLVASAQSTWNSNTSPKSTSASFTAVDDDVIVSGVLTPNDVADNGYAWSNGGTGQTWTENAETAGVTNNDVWMQTATTIATAFTGAITVTRNAGFAHTAAQFRGSDGIGTVARSTSAGGNPSFSFITSGDNSALVVFITDWSAADAAARIWQQINGQSPTEIAYFRDGANYTVAAAVYLDTGSAGSKSFGFTANLGTDWLYAAVEVLGTEGGDPIPILLESGQGYILLESGIELAY